MYIEKTSIFGAFLIKNKIFTDNRGFFSEVWNQKNFNRKLNQNIQFIQENWSHSKKNVLRGLHYQIKKPQAKLVRVTNGIVYDVIIDLRKFSPTFKKWYGVKLSSNNKNLLWVPAGCAHGFYVLSTTADFVYKTTQFWYPEYERCIIWNDKDLSIDWKFEGKPILSQSDSNGVHFKSAEFFE